MSPQVTLEAASERMTLLARGDRKRLTAKPQHIHVFDRTSGLRTDRR